LLSVSVAEKVIRKDLDNSQTDFVDKMVDEMSDKMDVKNN
jgi:F0F1-type ATP synthase membrane subunit b/b'